LLKLSMTAADAIARRVNLVGKGMRERPVVLVKPEAIAAATRHLIEIKSQTYSRESNASARDKTDIDKRRIIKS